MPPQAPSQQVPGSDVLLDTLRISKITDAQRQQIWDAYQTPGDEKAFTGALNKLDLDDGSKQTLYDIRFKGFKNLPTKGTTSQAPTAQPAAGPTPVSKGNVRPSEGKVLTDQNEWFAPGWESKLARGALRGIGTGLASMFPGLEKQGPSPEGGRPEDVAVMQNLVKSQEEGKKGHIPETFGYAAGAVLSPMGGTQAVQLGEAIGKKDIGATAEAAGSFLPQAILMARSGRVASDIVAGRPPFSGVDETTGLSKAEAIKFRGMGYTAQELSTLTSEQLDAMRKSPTKVNLNKATTSPVGATPQTTKVESPSSTRMGPMDTTKGPSSNTHIEVAAQAPDEARAEMTKSSVSADPTIVVAPKPFSFLGQAAPMRPYDPYGKRFAKGPTVGMEPIDVSKMVADPIEGGAKPLGGINAAGYEASMRPVSPSDQAASLRAETDELKDRLRSGKGSEEERNLVSNRIEENGKILEVLEPKTAAQQTQSAQVMDTVKQELGQTLAKRFGISYRGIQKGIEGKLEDHLSFWDPQSKTSVTIPLSQATEAEVEDYLGKLRGAISAAPPAPVKTGAAPYRPKSWDVPEQIHGNFNKISELMVEADIAESDKQSNAAKAERERLLRQAEAVVNVHIGAINGDQLLQLRDGASARADRLTAQAKAIRDLTEAHTKNKGLKGEIDDLKASGGPVRNMVVDDETGERAVVKPEEKAGGPAGREVLREALGGRAGERNIVVSTKPEGVGDDEWNAYINKLNVQSKALKRQVTDKISIAKDTGVSLDEVGVPELLSQLQQIEDLRGKYPEKMKAGRDKAPEAKLDEQGAIKAEEPLQRWTKERASLALGRKVNAIPSSEEFFQHADKLEEQGRLWRGVSEAADKTLKARNLRSKGERGAIGEVAGGIAGKVKMVSLADQVPDAKKMLAEAKRRGLDAWETNDDRKAGAYGWMSPDGKVWIANGSTYHAATAAMMLPEVERGGSAQRAMLDAGWIRRSSLTAFEATHLTKDNRNAIEMALLRDGLWGQKTYIDTRRSTDTGSNTWGLTLEAGWDDINKAILEAKKATRSQVGRIGGAALAGAATVGGVAGAAIGYHLAGPHGFYAGGAIGYATGFMTAATAPKLANAFNAIKGGLRNAGVTLHDWMYGPRQEASTLRDMATIRNAQIHDVQGPRLSLVQRLAQLPGELLRGQDDFYFINDRTSAMGKFLMSFDERGEKFRDLRGRISIDDSPYVAAWLAAGGSASMQEAHLMMYKSIFQDAQKAGLVEHVEDYLNLKAYQRAYQVLAERIRAFDAQIAQRQQALLQPNLGPRPRIKLQDQIKALQKSRQAVVDKITSRDVVPDPYNPAKIITDLRDLRHTLGNKFQDVQALANRVFDQNRATLDMIHQEGIITDEAYQQYVARGNEYIPMARIMEDMAETNGRLYGKDKPLYLRQQNVIKALNGSDRVNRNPFVASADATLEAQREVMRNNVMKKMLQLAAQDPQGVGSYFKRVRPGYKAAADEGLVGVYDRGQVHTFVVPAWLAETMKGAPPVANNIITKAMAKFGKVLRAGATVANFAWSLPNALRHFGDMAIMSDAGLKSIKTLPKDAAGLLRDWTKNVYSVMQQDPSWQEFLRSGAGAGVLQRMISPEENLRLDTLGFKGKLVRGRVLEIQADLNKAIEDVTKLTTFKRLRQAGLTETNAAWETRRYGGGPDFAKQGYLTREIGLASMFFNAHLQYVSRAFSRLVQQPTRILAALGAITVMSMAVAQHNWSMRDDRGNLLMRKVSFTDRENNFVILLPGTYTSPTGATMPYKLLIPKPSFVKFLANPIENAINKLAGREDRTGVQLGLRAISNLLPGQFDLQQQEPGKSLARGVVSSANPMLRVPAEQMMNYTTTGEGRPIVPGREQNLLPEFQYGGQTSAAITKMGEGGVTGAVAGGAVGASLGYTLGGAKGSALGGGLGAVVGAAGISPRRIEHAVYGTTSGVGQIATGFVDPFFGGVEQTRAEGPDKLSQTPIVGPIAHRFMGSSMDQEEATLSQQFYDSATQAKQIFDTLKYLEKFHPDQVEGFINTHKNELWKGQMATTMEQRLATVGQVQQIIMNSKATDADKREALKNLHDAKLGMLKVFKAAFGAAAAAPTEQAAPSQGQGAPAPAGKK